MNPFQNSSKRSYTDPFDELLEKKTHFRYFRTSRDHSRKQSQSSNKSLPVTCSSLSSDKSSRAESRLREVLAEIRSDSKDFSVKDCESKGDPYEMVTQDEVPKLIWCASCKAETSTYLIHTNGSSTLFNSVLICMFGGVLGCFLLPYCTDSCKDIKTVCSRCHHLIGEVND